MRKRGRGRGEESLEGGEMGNDGGREGGGRGWVFTTV